MNTRALLIRARTGLVAALLLGALGSTVPSSPVQAAGYAPISGSGSTWSQNALDQWRRDASTNYGLTVSYSGSGSSAGRRDYIQGTVDFAISEIPFQSAPEDGSAPESPPRGYAYMPIVAGGTAFMYHLNIGGQRVTNLQLSGDTVTKMFTGVITNWNDPAIASENPTLTLPDRPITPVVRSDGSGSTAQFTLWMNTQHKQLWNDFCAKVGRSAAQCGQTSQYPVYGNAKAQSGSNGVSGYVSQGYGEGSITYVEYSYAKNSGFPVVLMRNAAGQFVAPTDVNVAVALTHAQINSDLTQILTGVYNAPEGNAYPLSSYSYAIVPTVVGGIFNAEKGKTLSTFLSYVLCTGQAKAGALGYSPLPANLVKAGFDQLARIPGTVATGADAASCKDANAGLVDGSTPGADGGAGAGTGTTSTAGSGATASGATADAAGGAVAYDENGNAIGGVVGVASSRPFTLDEPDFGFPQALMIGAGVLLLLLVVVPPLVAPRMRRGQR